MAEPPGKFTAEELAEKAGVSLRTVRYYVQEEIIDPPFGRGPGKHFGDRHLLQIKRARLLQDSGFDLETIRDRIGGPPQLHQLFSPGLEEFERLKKLYGKDLGKLTSILNSAYVAKGKPAQGQAAPEKPSDEVRIPITDGVDLAVRKDVSFPSPKTLVQLAFAIRKAFEEADE